jgi:hypothetical protein
MNELSGGNVRRPRERLCLKARLKVRLFAVLVITVHVFGFIVFASLDSGSARHSCSYPSPVWTSTATQEEYDWVSVPRLYQTDQSLGFSRKLRFGTRAGDEPPHCVNLRLTIATLMLDIGKEWTLKRPLLKSSS